MAFASGEFLEVWSRTTTAELRQKSIWLNLLSKTGTEGWVTGAAKVSIPKPTWTNAAAANRARGGAWATAADISQDTVEFSRSGGVQVANEVLTEDALEIPWPLIDDLRSRQGYEMSKKIDEGLYVWITGGSGISTSVTYGTAGDVFISRVSPFLAKGDTAANTLLAKRLMYDIVDAFHLKLQRADALDGIGDPVGQKYIVMPPSYSGLSGTTCWSASMVGTSSRPASSRAALPSRPAPATGNSLLAPGPGPTPTQGRRSTSSSTLRRIRFPASPPTFRAWLWRQRCRDGRGRGVPRDQHPRRLGDTDGPNTVTTT